MDAHPNVLDIVGGTKQFIFHIQKKAELDVWYDTKSVRCFDTFA